MIDKPVQGAVDKATDNSAFEFAARAGFAISGVLHLLVAYIILRIAFGSGGSADQSGALATLAGQTGGAVMLWTAAVGLLALGAVAARRDGARPPSGRNRAQGDQDDSPLRKRLKALGLAILYLALAFSAARFAMGSGKSSSQQNAGMSAQLMQSGWGKALLILVGLAVLAVGGYHVYKGISERFLKDLRISGGRGITAIGVVGYVAKGLVLAGAGLLVIVATLNSDPVEVDGHRQRGEDARSRHRSERCCSSLRRPGSPPSPSTASCAAATAACSRAKTDSSRRGTDATAAVVCRRLG